MLKFLFRYFFLAFLTVSFSYSQSSFKFLKGEKRKTLSFKLINNLIIIPVEVNGVELSFVLDTGVNKPILFNLTDLDSLEIKNVEEIYIRGLGEGEPIKAFKSDGNRFKINNSIYNNNQELYVILDEDINFSPRLGFPIHGIIGYDLFKDFIIEINYASKRLKFFEPLTYQYKECKKCEHFKMEFVQNKPYLNAYADLEEKDNIEVKLLIDSGSSDALWLFEAEDKNIKVPKRYFKDFLGRGLSGNIYGERARVKQLHIGNFTLKEAKVAFPDSSSLKHIRGMEDRNGSLGAEVLKRFTVIFDYQNRRITLKKNRNFGEPFKYNMSGIELQHNGIRFVKELASTINGIVKDKSDPHGGVKLLLNESYKISLHPAFEIAEIRENSPAALAGLQRGDIIIAVNGRQTYKYSLQEVSEMLNEEEGKKIHLSVERNGISLKFSFELQKML